MAGFVIKQICFFMVLLFGALTTVDINAQTHLNRISIADRADSLGQVVRYHLTEPVDSFAIAWVEEHRIQMVLYSMDVTIQPPLELPESNIIREIQIYPFEFGIGFDFFLFEDQRVRPEAYRDVNQTDMLLALNLIGEDVPVSYIGRYLFTDEHSADTDTTNGYKPENYPTETDYAGIEKPTIPAGREAGMAGRLIFPGDPLEFYLRWADGNPENARIGHHSNYSGSQHTANISLEHHPHPWDKHPFFSESIARLGDHSDFFVLDPVLFTSFNSDYPLGGNDGALWQGRGFNTAFTMGAGYRYKFAEIVFRPVFINSDNRDFELSPTPVYPGLSEVAMPLTHGDIPQRFGYDAVNRIDLGDSYIKASYRGWTGGISNERMRTGPAIHNPLIFGYNAPGFLHGFIGTDTPAEFLNGRFMGRWFWGSLQDSGFFLDENTDTNLPASRYITGFTVQYNPNFVPGLHAGFTRAAISYPPQNGFGLSDLFMVFNRSLEKMKDTSPENSRFYKTSFFLRWHYPESGFEAYAEWGRNDNRRPFRDIILEPELNRGYVLGFLKRINAGVNRRIVMNGEITNLENSAVTSQSRDFNIWYTHPVIQQGFTHRGQVLGAPIGPGSSTQRLEVLYYDHFGMAGFSVGRIAHNNDRLFKHEEDHYKHTLPRVWMTLRRLNEIEMYYGLHVLLFFPANLEFSFDMRYSMIENRNNQYDRTYEVDYVETFFDEPNWHLSFTLRYRLNHPSF